MKSPEITQKSATELSYNRFETAFLELCVTEPGASREERLEKREAFLQAIGKGSINQFGDKKALYLSLSTNPAVGEDGLSELEIAQHLELPLTANFASSETLTHLAEVVRGREAELRVLTIDDLWTYVGAIQSKFENQDAVQAKRNKIMGALATNSGHSFPPAVR